MVYSGQTSPPPPPVTDRQQLDFLAYVQRLLSEGDFTATYKFALLVAIADLSVELGDDSGAPLRLSVDQLGEKFVQYYWPQAQPYPAQPGQQLVLRQNTGGQATVITSIAQAQARLSSLGRFQQNSQAWQQLVREVGRTVRKMPLWRLQVIGGRIVDELYPHAPPEQQGQATDITLRPGVAYCFRRFHRLVVDLAQGAWLAFVRRQNGDFLGQTTDLAQFLFGSERTSLAAYQPILRDLQADQCFYCRRRLQEERGDVDHFIPWALYPVDLGHNFVLAHGSCNQAKADRIAAFEHLERWCRRNEDHRTTLDASFANMSLPADLNASQRIARWAYEQVEANQAQVWRERNVLVPLDPAWRSLAPMTV